MSEQAPIFLKDYKVPDFKIKETFLEVDIFDDYTDVSARHTVIKNSADAHNLVLNGEHLFLQEVLVNKQKVNADCYELTGDHLTLFNCPEAFELEIKNRIYPHENKALEGLYISGHIFCTQCEAEGFRRITYSLDRPDNMTIYKTKIIADKKYPFLLSNGNCIEKGELGSRHFALWHDPYPKPSYLFALVAGDLGKVSDTFLTKSGRTVLLEIFVDKGNEFKCHFALESLKKAMKWDEDVYGLEYDLDIYMIVAVDSFNMGAMENKGLNIFNSSCVLADPATANDDDFLNIESIIAHEYFHNWTGNRVTCRDWFQLTLKEGLTVFRDQQFSADQHGEGLQRIRDVKQLIQRQFVEDQGSLAHPIRPEKYHAINNFYSATVYDKGAEVIRMMFNTISAQNYYKGMKHYFTHFDGMAITTENFIQSLEVGSGISLSAMETWYHQAGTPTLCIAAKYSKDFKLILSLEQKLDQSVNEGITLKPQGIPVHFSFIDIDLEKITLPPGVTRSTEGTLKYFMTDFKAELEFKNVEKFPLISFNRNFAAPIHVDYNYRDSDLAAIAMKETDVFNAWQAMQSLWERSILDYSQEKINLICDVLTSVLTRSELNYGLAAEMMDIPSDHDINSDLLHYQLDLVHENRNLLIAEVTQHLHSLLHEVYSKINSNKSNTFDSQSVFKRALKNKILFYLGAVQGYEEIISKQYYESSLMTDVESALTVACTYQHSSYLELLSDFYNKWKHDNLVMNKWLTIQAKTCQGSSSVEELSALELNEVYNKFEPNKVRALWGTFMKNSAQYHRLDGKGYEKIINLVVELDHYNPQIASRIARGFDEYNKLDVPRKKIFKKYFEKVVFSKLSVNTLEIMNNIKNHMMDN